MRIALVEDEQKLAKTLREGLESEGYEVKVLSYGESAIKEFRTNGATYALIVLDLMLPGKDGFEVCEAVRAAGITVPILVLTARDATEDKVRALNLGADDFLTKPFSFDELTARIRAHVRRSKGFPGSKVTIGSLTVSFATREVFRDAKSILLTPTEFDLLHLLLENPDRAVTREQISSHLWNSEDTTLTNIVEVHISNLRKKIDDEYDQKVIRTVRGVGYAIQK